jgi:hypothetical protein
VKLIWIAPAHPAGVMMVQGVGTGRRLVHARAICRIILQVSSRGRGLGRSPSTRSSTKNVTNDDSYSSKLMLSEDMNAETAAFEVGHESPQFRREHTRMFRVPPRRDIVAVQFDSVTPCTFMTVRALPASRRRAIAPQTATSRRPSRTCRSIAVTRPSAAAFRRRS